MQISTIKNLNLKKPSRNPSNRTIVKILKQKFFGYLLKKFGSTYAQSPRKCSNFEILAKIEGNKAEFFRKFTEFWIYSVYGKFYLKLVRGASPPVRPENPPILS